MSNDVLEKVMEDLERVFSKQLPKAKAKLSELLKMEHPHVVCRDGSLHSFKMKELETLSSLLPPENWDNLELPILIASNPTYGEGAMVISGKYEVQVVSELLNIQTEGPEQDLLIFRSQLVELRRKLRTVTQVAFQQSEL